MVEVSKQLIEKANLQSKPWYFYLHEQRTTPISGTIPSPVEILIESATLERQITSHGLIFDLSEAPFEKTPISMELFFRWAPIPKKTGSSQW